MNKKIGKVSKKVIEILGLEYDEEKPIFIGDSNMEHIEIKHEDDFKKYGANIADIIKNPTYLARNEKKSSIEYIKRYKIDNEYVMVVVRVSKNDVHFVRTMYIMADEKVTKYFKHNYFYKF